MIRDALGDRMKHNYEEVTKTRLTRRLPVIIRLDGCHFHTFTRGFDKPFDKVLIKTMQQTMKYLCENIQGCILGYTQSDEITLVLADYKEINSEAWFDYETQKMVSVSASLATFAFNKYFAENVKQFSEGFDEAWNKSEKDTKLLETYNKALEKGAYFDSRVFNIPKEEVTNCVYWRQKDAERNSINSLAQSLFSHKSLQGLKLGETLTKIEQEGGVIWGNLPTTCKRGSCCIKEHKFILPDGQVAKERQEIVYEGHKGCFYFDNDGYYFFYSVQNTEDLSSMLSIKSIKLDKIKENSKWIIDNEIPQFKDEDRKYIEELVTRGA